MEDFYVTSIQIQIYDLSMKCVGRAQQEDASKWVHLFYIHLLGVLTGRGLFQLLMTTRQPLNMSGHKTVTHIVAPAAEEHEQSDTLDQMLSRDIDSFYSGEHAHNWSVHSHGQSSRPKLNLVNWSSENGFQRIRGVTTASTRFKMTRIISHGLHQISTEH